MGTTLYVIRKYHITDSYTGLTAARYPLVFNTQQVFWQLKPPLLEFCGTFEVKLVFKFIENSGENETLTLKQLSEETAFLVAFSTLSMYCLVSHLTKLTFPEL